ncbi:hypothetical protein ACVWW6_005523 [Bradyrhizobium sp. USDA 3311]
MVARPGTYQASNNAGELAPEEYGRTDLKQFYAGLATALNIEPVPQGGSKLSMRTRHLGRVRHPLQIVALTSSTLPVGSYNTAAVLATATFASADISVVNLTNWSASQALGAILQIEYASGASWVPFGAAFTLGTDSGTITMALPPGQKATTTQIRVRMVSAPPSATTFAATGIVVRNETANKPVGRIRPFTFSLDQTYVAVLQDSHVDLYRDGVYVGASMTNFTAGQLATLDTPQRLDTMLLFHHEQASQKILRDGADTKWVLSGVPFENIPNVDLGGTYTNQVADRWSMYVRFPGGTSDYSGGKNLSVNMTVNGETTNTIVTADPPDWGAFAASVKSAIEGTSSVDPGITVTYASSGANAMQFDITFVGGNNLGRVNTLAAQVVNTAEAAATTAHTQTGDPGGEPLISAGRGYAAAATFYQDRLVTGGFNAKRSAWLGSVTGEYFDLNVKLTGASGAVLANLDTDGAEQIHRIVRDIYLLFFTSDAEYFISDRAIDRTKPPNIVNSSRRGSAADLPVVVADQVIWASRDKNVLYAASYDAVNTKYVETPISLLAPHIVNGMVDMAFQKPADKANAGRLWMPRVDGSMTVGVFLLNQDITAFVRWQTGGNVTSACVDGKNVPHILVEREVSGVTELHLERLEDGLIFDDVVEQDFSPAQQVITGLGVHEGAEVWAEADGYVVGPFTVESAAIDLGFAASNVLVGRWTMPVAKSLPLPSEVAERVVLKRPKRVHTVRVDAVDTTSIAIGANDRPARNVALEQAGEAIGPQPLVNSEIVVTGLSGFTQTGQIVITQTRPGRLAWRGFTIEAKT